ncbi:MAG: aspartate ammonia-lyase [Kiritimatiellia bacterium]
MTTSFRTEHDLLGNRQVPAEAYWGIHTLRALENFPISGKPIGSYPHLIRALALVKLAAARANRELGELDPATHDAIVAACGEIAAGRLHDQFAVDVIQGGAGTSTNMNANEVIANLALEKLGWPKGHYEAVHPINHVNMSQSTNDVYPTAVKLALVFLLVNLQEAMGALKQAFADKAAEFREILKIGRTQLQDAVPMTLGQEFSTYAVMIDEDIARLREATALVREVNLGATAIGTGINTDERYAGLAVRFLSEAAGVDLIPALNLVEATQDTGSFVQLSGVLKRIACKLSKICNDLRLLSSGPQAGFGEINLPERAAGSSIMPGKVNPIIPEVVNQIAFEVIGNDMTITMASEGGQLQLNAFEPIIAHSLFKSIEHLAAGCRTLALNCVRGITANRALLAERVRTSAGLATALNPHIGYEKATWTAREALRSGRTVSELVLEKGWMTAEELNAVLRPEILTAPRAPRAGRAAPAPGGK